MPKERNSNLKYERIPYENIEDLLQLFQKRFDEFLLLKGFPDETEKHISFYTLMDIIVRVDKRKKKLRHHPLFLRNNGYLSPPYCPLKRMDS